MKGIAYVRALGPNEGTFAPSPDPEVQKAHAQFIAAAPLMAKALQAAEDELLARNGTAQTVAKIRTALTAAGLRK
jgi:hypothetical protein